MTYHIQASFSTQQVVNHISKQQAINQLSTLQPLSNFSALSLINNWPTLQPITNFPSQQSIHHLPNQKPINHMSQEQPTEASLAVAVDDSGDLYIDGEIVIKSMSIYRSYNTTRLRFNSRVIAVEIYNSILWGGVIIETSNGIVTDQSWKCTKEKQNTK